MNYLNKKIKGAKIVEYKNIKFRSKLELACYKKLEESGLEFSYETEKFILNKSFKPENIIIYVPKKLGVGKYDKNLELSNKTILSITYTPDFIVVKDNYKIYFDVKGKENDTYPIKKKIFLKLLEEKNDDINYIFFEPHSVKQMLQAIEIINNL